MSKRDDKKLIVMVCIDIRWFKGYCEALGIDCSRPVQVLKPLKEKVEEHCKDGGTPCKTRVRMFVDEWLKNGRMAVWIESDTLNTPRGCQIRQLEKDVIVLVNKYLEDMKEG